LRLPELSVEARGLLLYARASVESARGEQVGRGNGEHDAVERALGPVLLKEPRELVPTALVRRLAVAPQNHVARNVEDYAPVEEEPTEALLHAVRLLGGAAQGEPEPRLAERGALPRTRLADHQKPGETITVVAARDVRAQSPHRARERSLEPERGERRVEAGGRRVFDGDGRGRGSLRRGAQTRAAEHEVEDYRGDNHQQH